MRVGVKKLIWSLPVIAVLIFGVGIASSVTIATTALTLIDQVSAADYPLLDRMKSLSAEVQRIADDFNGAVAEGEKKKLEDAAAGAERIRKLLDKIGELPGQEEFARKARSTFDEYYRSALIVARSMLGIDKADAQPSIAAMQGSIRLLNQSIEKGTKDATDQFAANLAASGRNIRIALWVIAGAALVAFLVLMVVSSLIVRAIWRQLGGEPEYATRIVRGIAGGNLSMPIELVSGDNRSQLAAMKGMQASLATLIANIRVAADSVRTGASEISRGMTDLSSRTEEQATSLEETASSMEELTATVQQNAQNAMRATGLAQASTAAATQGGEVVQNVIAKMDEINRSAAKIADIISVIDGIAFRIHILALNAAIEAAGAGEHGRGFAVVATEVRSLAHQSAASAKEIKELIRESVQTVETGRNLVSEAGETMTRIVQSISEVSSVVSEIATASTEQATGISQVGAAVVQIEGVTQQNAALVEQTSAAAESMSIQARELEEAVSVFKLLDPALAAGPSDSRSTPSPSRQLSADTHKSAWKRIAPKIKGPVVS